MIVWVASFPRSGNTFLRIALNRLYGIRTSVVYDFDGVARRVGETLVGFEERPMSYEAMRRGPTVHFVKTHKPRFDHRIAPEDLAVYLARDGRDALVSWACQQSEDDAAAFEPMLRKMIEANPSGGSGRWGGNVLSWLRTPGVHLLRYDDLIRDPQGCLARLVPALDPARVPRVHALVPSFAELQQLDDRFFRRGFTGTPADEMPPVLHDLFWAQPENVEAMSVLGLGEPNE